MGKKEKTSKEISEKVSDDNYSIKLEESLGYTFRDKSLLITAITHSTYSYENKHECSANNERLEFLGDSVLDLIVGDILYRDIAGMPEGVMSKVRALVVCENTLSEIANDLDIGKHLLLGKGEELTGGREKLSNLSNAVEAVIAALYLDGGYEEAYRVSHELLKPYILRAKKGKIVYDHKSRFLEYIQGIQKQNEIKFSIVKEEGPEHKRTFFAQVTFLDTIIGSGCGSTKKEAEQEAAREAYEKITSVSDFPLDKDKDL